VTSTNGGGGAAGALRLQPAEQSANATSKRLAGANLRSAFIPLPVDGLQETKATFR
jgi:hypothetical protein